MAAKDIPKSLIQMVRYFSDADVCIEFVASLRWPDGKAVCQHCGSKNCGFLKTRRIWKCRDCRMQFSVKVGTIFEESPIALDKWLMAIWLVVNCKNGISSYEIARDLKVTQKSAWFMLHRIRLALRTGSWDKRGGSGSEFEADEASVGGKPVNMHKSRRLRIARERGERRTKDPQQPFAGKTAVMGLYDRESRQVRAKVVPNVRRETLQNEILESIDEGSTIYTDASSSYLSLKDKYVHDTVNHVNEYVRGEVHTNCLENFWSLMKRSLHGTYVAVEPFHLDRYVGEQVFRFNNRTTRDNPLDDADRFMLAVSQISGKRLTYAELTGKVQETSF